MIAEWSTGISPFELALTLTTGVERCCPRRVGIAPNMIASRTRSALILYLQDDLVRIAEDILSLRRAGDRTADLRKELHLGSSPQPGTFAAAPSVRSARYVTVPPSCGPADSEPRQRRHRMPSARLWIRRPADRDLGPPDNGTSY